MTSEAALTKAAWNSPGRAYAKTNLFCGRTREPQKCSSRNWQLMLQPWLGEPRDSTQQRKAQGKTMDLLTSG